MKMPKAITTHPGVLECLDAKSQGFLDYKYDVFLKPEWRFENGRMGGARGGRFNNVSDFKYANPVKIS